MCLSVSILILFSQQDENINGTGQVRYDKFDDFQHLNLKFDLYWLRKEGAQSSDYCLGEKDNKGCVIKTH